MDRALPLYNQLTPSLGAPIFSFADWRDALSGNCSMVSVEPVVPQLVLCELPPAMPSLASAAEVPALSFWAGPPEPRRLSGLSLRVGKFVARTQAKQTFAGIAVLVMLLIWAI